MCAPCPTAVSLLDQSLTCIRTNRATLEEGSEGIFASRNLPIRDDHTSGERGPFWCFARGPVFENPTIC
jgi:hypothetical protein